MCVLTSCIPYSGRGLGSRNLVNKPIEIKRVKKATYGRHYVRFSWTSLTLLDRSVVKHQRPINRHRTNPHGHASEFQTAPIRSVMNRRKSGFAALTRTQKTARVQHRPLKIDGGMLLKRRPCRKRTTNHLPGGWSSESSKLVCGIQ